MIIDYPAEVLQAFDEGVYDLGIFKAIVLVGGPGSGKSAFSKQANVSAMGFKPIVSDDVFEYVEKIKKIALNLKYGQFEVVRTTTKEISRRRELTYIHDRLALISETSLTNVANSQREVKELRSYRYHVKAVFIHTPVEKAMAFNRSRERNLPDDWVKERNTKIESDFEKYREIFKNEDVYIVENDSTLEDLKNNLADPIKSIKMWMRQLPKSLIAKRWMANQLKLSSKSK